MGIYFDSETGARVDSADQVRDAVRQAFVRAFAEDGKPPLNTDPETPAGQLIDTLTALVVAKDSAILHLANMFNPEVAEGIWQDALGKIYFLDRKANQSSVVECVCTGRLGTVIPQGSLVRDTNGRVLVSTHSATIPASGQVTITFKTQDSGSIPIDPHSVTTIVTIIPGWDTVDNENAGALGREKETHAEFEARRKLSVANRSHGSAASIYAAVNGLDNVLDCQVLENYTSEEVEKYGITLKPHSVCISVYGGDDGEIARTIYEKKDLGCDTTGNTEVRYIARELNDTEYVYNIMRPEPTNFYIKVDMTVTDTTPTDVEEQIEAALIRNFTGLDTFTNDLHVGMSQTVYASRFYAPVVNVAGVKEINDLKIAMGDEEDYVITLDIPGDKMPVLSAETIQIIMRDKNGEIIEDE